MPPPTTPRVRPRMPMEQMVDRKAHPPRRRIATKDHDPAELPWPTRAALVLLGVFVVALPAAGILGPLLGLWAGLGSLGLAASSLVASILLGSE